MARQSEMEILISSKSIKLW